MGAFLSCLFQKNNKKYKQSQHKDDHNNSSQLNIKITQAQTVVVIQEPIVFQEIKVSQNPPPSHESEQIDMEEVILYTNISNKIQVGENSNDSSEIDSLEENSVIMKSIPFTWVEGELIGQGSFGIVRMGMNKKTGQVIAVKQVFLKSFSQQVLSEKIDALEKEIYLLSRLKHKNIVQYLGMEKTTDTLNIFLEYVSGGSVQSMITKFGKFKETLIKVYLRQILCGLQYLHSKKVIHRDIKGGNILVDNNGTIKLADFGSSKKLGEIVNTDTFGSLCGTPNYMAPEVVNQERYGRKADIWSLGCTIIEMATGKPPWSEYNNVIAIMLRIAKADRPPEFPSHLSSKAKSFLDACLRIKPEERWTVNKLLKHPFVQLRPPLSNPQLKTGKSNMLQLSKQNSQQQLDDLENNLNQRQEVDIKPFNQFIFNVGTDTSQNKNIIKFDDVNHGLSPHSKQLNKQQFQNYEINFSEENKEGVVSPTEDDFEPPRFCYQSNEPETKVIQVIQKTKEKPQFKIEILHDDQPNTPSLFTNPKSDLYTYTEKDLSAQKNYGNPKIQMQEFSEINLLPNFNQEESQQSQHIEIIYETPSENQSEIKVAHFASSPSQQSLTYNQQFQADMQIINLENNLNQHLLEKTDPIQKQESPQKIVNVINIQDG